MGVQALILAAGSGSRVNPKEAGTVKPLLEVGRRPLVDHLLETLADAGVGPVAMVVGFGADEILETVGIKAEYIHNSRWATTNSLYSFSLARSWVTGPVMVFNGDLLLHPQIVERLLAAGEDSIAYDSSSRDGSEHMVDAFSDGALSDMGKGLSPPGVGGENVGAIFFSADTARVLFDRAERILSSGGEKEWLGAVLREIARERRIRGVDIAGLPWVEIDYPYDLARARDVVWPAIRRTAWKRTTRWRVFRFLIPAVVIALLAPVVTRGLFPPESPAVTTVEPDGAQCIEISMGDRQQKWWLADGGRTIGATVSGPDPLRIETRLILNQEQVKDVPYVVELLLDGRQAALIRLKTRASETARYGDWKIGKRRRFELDLPRGQHFVSARLVAPEGCRCLMRFRQAEGDADD